MLGVVCLIAAVVLLVASALASMRWLLCGEKMRVRKEQYLELHINYTR